MLYGNQRDWMETYRNHQALWVHGGDPKKPHVVLSAGEHSSGFFNSVRVTENSRLANFAASDLVEKLRREGLDPNNIDRVVGPAMGAITLAHDISRHIGRVDGRACLSGYAEKIGEGANKTMVFKKTILGKSERLLYAEDVLTTGSSVQLMDDPVRQAGAIILPWIAVLVNRSGLKEVGGKKIVALIDHPMPKWQADACPLCAQGSEAIPAKDNWSRLNG